MSRGSGVCIAMADRLDFPNYACCMTCGIICVGFCNVNIKHHTFGGGNFSIPLTLKSMNSLLNYMKYKEFLNETNFLYPFNLTKIRNLLKPNPEIILESIIENNTIKYIKF
jgi:hypothetical protein